jgi:hypothetical protein
MARMTTESRDKKEDLLIKRLAKSDKTIATIREKWDKALQRWEKTNYSSRWLLIANKYGNTLQVALDKRTAILDKLEALRTR